MEKLDISKITHDQKWAAMYTIQSKVNQIVQWINEHSETPTQRQERVSSEPVELPKEEKCRCGSECCPKCIQQTKDLDGEPKEKSRVLIDGHMEDRNISCEHKETSLRDGESLLDKQLKKIEEAFEKQERELEKLKPE